MLQQERFDRILERLNFGGSVKVAQLSAELNVSESTVRRDISQLDRQGRLRKVFGGAVSVQRLIRTVEEDMATKSEVRVREKLYIAKRAAELIEDGDFVFIDAGSTTENMLDFIGDCCATYVTNGVTHGRRLAQRGFRVYMTGGFIKGTTLSLVGAEAVGFIDRCNFTKCFMGADGIDVQRGYSTPDLDEALLKAEVIRRSSAAYILADGSKFGAVSAVSFADIEQARVITDRLKDSSFKKYTQIEETGETPQR